MGATGVAHVGFGLVSLVVGSLVLFLAKGTTTHRALGTTLVLCLFGLNLTALLIYRVFGGFGPFHALSVLNLIILLAGFASAVVKWPRTRWLRNHYYLMGWAYVGLLTATGAEIMVRVPGVPWMWAVVAPSLLIPIAGGAYVSLHQRRTMARLAAHSGGSALQGEMLDR